MELHRATLQFLEQFEPLVPFRVTNRSLVEGAASRIPQRFLRFTLFLISVIQILYFRGTFTERRGLEPLHTLYTVLSVFQR